MKKIIDLGMHPYADTFIKKDQLNKDPVAFFQNTQNNTFADFPVINMAEVKSILKPTGETKKN